jgi:hypothetical protein
MHPFLPAVKAYAEYPVFVALSVDYCKHLDPQSHCLRMLLRDVVVLALRANVYDFCRVQLVQQGRE